MELPGRRKRRTSQRKLMDVVKESMQRTGLTKMLGIG